MKVLSLLEWNFFCYRYFFNVTWKILRLDIGGQFNFIVNSKRRLSFEVLFIFYIESLNIFIGF